jgi:hypothetical protein
MRVLRMSMQFAVFIMLFVFLACASTKFYDTWTDAAYQGRPEKILVIDMFQDPSIRRLFEDEIVKALRDYRVDAVVKYTVAPADTVVSDKDVIARQAKEVGADTVLITRPVDKRADLYHVTTVYIDTRTDIYDVKSKKFIAFASGQTQIRQGLTDTQHYFSEVPSFANDLVAQLSRMGLF